MDKAEIALPEIESYWEYQCQRGELCGVLQSFHPKDYKQ